MFNLTVSVNMRFGLKNRKICPQKKKFFSVLLDGLGSQGTAQMKGLVLAEGVQGWLGGVQHDPAHHPVPQQGVKQRFQSCFRHWH